MITHNRRKKSLKDNLQIVDIVVNEKMWIDEKSLRGRYLYSIFDLNLRTPKGGASSRMASKGNSFTKPSQRSPQEFFARQLSSNPHDLKYSLKTKIIRALANGSSASKNTKSPVTVMPKRGSVNPTSYTTIKQKPLRLKDFRDALKEVTNNKEKAPSISIKTKYTRRGSNSFSYKGYL